MTGSAQPLVGTAAIVTGGGSGIGRAAAEILVRDGATVTLMGRTPDKLERVAADLEELTVEGADVRTCPGDVTDEDDVAAAVAAAADSTGKLDVAVGSHGAGMIGPLLQLDRSVWELLITTNLTGSFLLMKHAGAAMARSGGGSIVAVSSIAADVSHQFMTAYAASKRGLDGLVESVASELGRFDIRVNAVRPGYVPGTDLTSAIPDAEQFEADCLEQIPLGRLGSVDDIARGIRYLAGPESAWVTGVCLSINGGQHLRRGPDYELLTRQLFGDEFTDMIP